MIVGPVSFYESTLQMGIDNAPLILLSASICWILAEYVFIYSGVICPQYNSLTARQKNEWNGRLVAMVHAVFAVTLVPGYIWPPKNLADYDPVNNKHIIKNYGYDPHTQFIYCVSVGYFLWDSIVCIQHQWGFEYIIHGVLSFLVYYMNLFPFLHYWGRFYLGYFELSTIPLHFRGCMIMLKYNKNPEKLHLFMLAQNIWVVSYFICRILIGTYVTYAFLMDLYALWKSGQYHALHALILSVFVVNTMMLLMYYWFYQIVCGLFARGRQNDRRNNEDQDNKEKT